MCSFTGAIPFLFRSIDSRITTRFPSPAGHDTFVFLLLVSTDGGQRYPEHAMHSKPLSTGRIQCLRQTSQTTLEPSAERPMAFQQSKQPLNPLSQPPKIRTTEGDDSFLPLCHFSAAHIH